MILSIELIMATKRYFIEIGKLHPTETFALSLYDWIDLQLWTVEEKQTEISVFVFVSFLHLREFISHFVLWFSKIHRVINLYLRQLWSAEIRTDFRFGSDSKRILHKQTIVCNFVNKKLNSNGLSEIAEISWRTIEYWGQVRSNHRHHHRYRCRIPFSLIRRRHIYWSVYRDK